MSVETIEFRFNFVRLGARQDSGNDSLAVLLRLRGKEVGQALPGDLPSVGGEGGQYRESKTIFTEGCVKFFERKDDPPEPTRSAEDRI